jgi:hypothetical protein
MVRAAQPTGSAQVAHWRVLRNATVAVAIVAGCARGGGEVPDASGDAAAIDAPRHVDAPDARVIPDAPLDAGCGISTGVSPVIDGVHDLADYPAAQHVALGAMLGADDAAVAWDRQRLYITVASTAWASQYLPLHVYVETATTLGAAVPAQGKEYSGLVPQLPFSPTYLIAARRVSDSGTGPYDGVYAPASSWTMQQTPLVAGSDVFVSSDQAQLSVQVPWSALGGCPSALRLVVHVVNGASGNEWKDLVPTSHTPWLAPGGGYYEIDLTGEPAVASWHLH